MSYWFALVLFGLGALYHLHIPPWTSFHNEALAFAGLAVLVRYHPTGHRQAAGGGHQLPTWPWVALAVALGYQTWAHANTYLGDMVLLALYGAGAAMAWGWGQAHGARLTSAQTAQAGLAVVGVGWLTATACWLQFARLDHHWPTWVLPLELAPRAFGNLGQPNHTATVLVSAWLALTWLADKGRCRTGWWVLGSLPLLSAVVLTQSRTGALSVWVACALGLWLTRQNTRRRLPGAHLKAWHWWLSAVVFAAVFWTFHHNASQSIGTAKMAATGNRPTIWAQIADGVAQHPWLGYGWMRVPQAQQQGAVRIPGRELVDFSHNALLDQWVWWGAPLALLGLSVGAVWLLKTWRLAGSGRCWPVLMVTPLAVHSQLEMPYAYAYFLWPALVLLGGWTGRTWGSAAPDLSHTPRRAAWLAWSTWGAFVALGLAVVVSYAQVEQAFRDTRFAMGKFQGAGAPTTPETGLLTHMEDALWALQLEPREALPDADMQRLERTAQRFSWQAVHARWVVALVYQERYTEAAAHLQLIAHLFGPVMHQEMLTMLAQKGETDGRFRRFGSP